MTVEQRNARTSWLAVAALVGIIGSGQVFGAAVLSTDSGVFGSTVSDNSLGDDNADVGVIVVNGAVGAWNVSVDTGITKPALGSAGAANMDLNGVALSTNGATDPLTIEFWDFDFSASGNLIFDTAIGGTTQNSSISWQACVGSSNTASCTTTITSGSSNQSAFSASDQGSANLTAPYSIGLIATITPTSASSIASFDFQITQVPVPAAAWLFASALLGLAGIARRKQVV